MDEWTCKICGTENPAEEDICHECGAYRYEEAYDAISDEEDETSNEPHAFK